MPVLSDSNEQALGAERKRFAVPLGMVLPGTIFLSAFLLFQVQPILAKLILPWFGGAAAVWIISLAFYQLAYLLGNLYAHILIGAAGRVFRAAFTRCCFWPVCCYCRSCPASSGNRAAVQSRCGEFGACWRLRWASPFCCCRRQARCCRRGTASRYEGGREGARPYRFYALSNAGSLLALLSYPVVVEPLVSTHRQALIWSVGYGVCVALCLTLAFRSPALKLALKAQPVEDRPGWKLQLLWLALAASASALLLSITHYVSQNIAAVPLLWIVPLSLYLLTLILCFEGQGWYSRRIFLPLLPIALGGMAYALAPKFENAGPELQLLLYFGGLFICCMVCHGEMAALKPGPRFLTVFYLMVSAGGAVGGLLAALVAPYVFRGFYELPLALGRVRDRRSDRAAEQTHGADGRRGGRRRSGPARDWAGRPFLPPRV